MGETMRERAIEAAALAAWLRYCGADEPRDDWMDDTTWHEKVEEREQHIRDWNQWPTGCTHIGAQGFRDCAAAAFDAVLAELREPTEAMLNAVIYVDAMPATKRAIWHEMIDAATKDPA